MSILRTAAHEETLDGVSRRLQITNREIDRFEAQHIGIFDFWDQLFGHKPGLKAGHVRDMVALALVGGGLADLRAEAVIAALGPDHNQTLRLVAQRALGLAFYPAALVEDVKKNQTDGSGAAAEPSLAPEGDTTPATGSETSAGQ